LGTKGIQKAALETHTSHYPRAKNILSPDNRDSVLIKKFIDARPLIPLVIP